MPQVGQSEILCPIVVFLDKTHTDAKGRLTQEPVMFTLGIFNQETRNNPKAWRPLGLLPNFKHLHQAKTVHERNADFHFVLSEVLADLKEAQSSGGLKVRFPYQGKDIEALLKIPVAAVLGDHEGQNKNCGHRGCKSAFLCRRCKIHRSNTDRPMRGRPFKATEIDQLRSEKKKKELEALSHYQIDLGTAYQGVDFGADDGGGINLMSWPDLMHTIKHGLMDRLRSNLLSEWMPLFSKDFEKYLAQMKQLRKSKDKDAMKGTKPVEKRLAFNQSLIDVVDLVAKYWGQLLQHQSDREIGRIHFQNGIASGEATKFTCGEMPAVMLLFAMILSSGLGYQFFDTPKGTTEARFQAGKNKLLKDNGQRFRLDMERTADYIWAFEETIMLSELLTSSEMTVEFVLKYLAPYIDLMMKRWTQKLPRYHGNGWKLTKFHNLVHLPEMLVQMGNVKVTDTETGEHLHVHVKAKAQTTQRQQKTFDQQVGVRLHESRIIERAKTELGITFGKKAAKLTCDEGSGGVSCPRGVFGADGKFASEGLQFFDISLRRSIEDFLYRAVMVHVNRQGACSPMHYYTEARIKIPGKKTALTLFRADPSFYTLKGAERGWHDLAIATKPKVAEDPKIKVPVPVQLLGFLKFDGLDTPFQIARKYNNRQPKVTPGSEWAIVHAFNKYPQDPFEGRQPNYQSRLLSVANKITHSTTNSRNKFLSIFLISIADITDTCVGVPNVFVEEATNQKNSEYRIQVNRDYEFIFVTPKSKWAAEYMRWIKKECLEQNVKPMTTQQEGKMMEAAARERPEFSEWDYSDEDAADRSDYEDGDTSDVEEAGSTARNKRPPRTVAAQQGKRRRRK